ncbi:MAG: TonB-dependent receptor [Flavobacteriaceae bacterium]|nr:TonB-dependent receptor [Flavobacteriaceae bacterium]
MKNWFTDNRLQISGNLPGALCMTFCSLLVTPVAHGQSKTEVQTESSADSAEKDYEIIEVSAQRRLQDMQDVPVTVTQFGSETIKNARLREVEDVAVRTPGLTFDAFPSSQPRLFVRGVGSADRGAGGDPSTAVFLDEVYLGRPAAIAFDVFDTASIEVLKGPQGTLYGRNVVGGAVSINTAKPELDELSGSVEATAGNFNRKEGSAFVNIPVIDDTVAIRMSGAIRNRGGYVDNLYTGGEVDDQDSKHYRIHGLIEPNDDISILLSYDMTKDDGAGPDQHVLDLDTEDPLSAYWTVDQTRDITRSETDGRQKRETWGSRGQLIWDLGYGSLNYLISYRELEYDSYYDLDGGNAEQNAINLAAGNIEDSELFSQELRLQSNEDSDIAWVLGLYQYNADTIRRDLLDISIAGPTGTEVFYQNVELDSLAAYADVTFPVNDELNITAGIRYTEDEKWQDINNSESNTIVRSDEPFDVQASASWDAVTWRIGADYHLAKNHMIYTMISRGFKSGGFQDNPTSADAAAQPYDPEYATQYEVGMRSDYFNRSVIWNNTLFYMDYTNLQTSQIIGFNAVTENAGEASIKGYETDLRWRLDNGLSVNLNYAYTDATFDVFEEGGNDYAGNQMSRTPKHKAVLTPSYSFLFNNGNELLYALDYTYQSRIFDDNSNNDLEQREPSHVVNSRLIYTDGVGEWSVSLWAKNITNEKIRTHQGTFLGATLGSFNAPRTFGVTLRWNHY